MDEITGQSVAVVKQDTYFAPSVRNILSWRRGETVAHGKEHVRTSLQGGVQISLPLVGGN